MIAMAQQFIDQAQQEAEVRAREMTVAAQERAREIVAEARSRAEDEVTRLNGLKQRLSEDVDDVDAPTRCGANSIVDGLVRTLPVDREYLARGCATAGGSFEPRTGTRARTGGDRQRGHQRGTGAPRDPAARTTGQPWSSPQFRATQRRPRLVQPRAARVGALVHTVQGVVHAVNRQSFDEEGRGQEGRGQEERYETCAGQEGGTRQEDCRSTEVVSVRREEVGCAQEINPPGFGQESSRQEDREERCTPQEEHDVATSTKASATKASTKKFSRRPSQAANSPPPRPPRSARPRPRPPSERRPPPPRPRPPPPPRPPRSARPRPRPPSREGRRRQGQGRRRRQGRQGARGQGQGRRQGARDPAQGA